MSKFSITSPKDKSVVNGPFHLRFKFPQSDIKNLKLGLYVNDTLVRIFEALPMLSVPSLPPGVHSIRAQLTDSKDKELGSDVIRVKWNDVADRKAEKVGKVDNIKKTAEPEKLKTTTKPEKVDNIKKTTEPEKLKTTKPIKSEKVEEPTKQRKPQKELLSKASNDPRDVETGVISDSEDSDDLFSNRTNGWENDLGDASDSDSGPISDDAKQPEKISLKSNEAEKISLKSIQTTSPFYGSSAELELISGENVLPKNINYQIVTKAKADSKLYIYSCEDIKDSAFPLGIINKSGVSFEVINGEDSMMLEDCAKVELLAHKGTWIYC